MQNITNLDQLLQIAEDKNASDLHIISGMPPVLRLDGKLIVERSLPIVDNHFIEAISMRILTKDQRERFLKDKDLDFAYQISSGVRYRVNLFFEKGNISLAARVIPKIIPTLKDIHLDSDFASSLIHQQKGLILVTGPSGCGKSTVLASLIGEINRTRSVNIITLEDPIEFIYSPEQSIIRQRELGADMLSFAEGLKHALRQDPNVIMVGEMRDIETMSTTVTLAETGHLVFATLHTFNAEQTIDRIVGSFPPYEQDQIRIRLSLTLVAVISQRLLERIDAGKRVAAREILINTPAVANLIRENKIEQIKNVIQTSSKGGMVTLEHSIQKFVDEGIISQETADSQLMLPGLKGKI